MLLLLACLLLGDLLLVLDARRPALVLLLEVVLLLGRQWLLGLALLWDQEVLELLLDGFVLRFFLGLWLLHDIGTVVYLLGALHLELLLDLPLLGLDSGGDLLLLG